MSADDPADPETMTRELARTIRTRLDGRGLAVAESCTAGAVAVALTTAGDGASWLRGSLVAYQEAVKRSLLGVEAESLVSPEAAGEMARGITDLLRADVAIATTGVLGDEPVDGVDPPTVVIATLVDGRTRVHRHELENTRDAGRREAVRRALEQLADHLGTGSGTDGG